MLCSDFISGYMPFLVYASQQMSKPALYYLNCFRCSSTSFPGQDTCLFQVAVALSTSLIENEQFSGIEVFLVLIFSFSVDNFFQC